MGIQKDAGKVLLLLYKHYIEYGNLPSYQLVINSLNLEKKKLTIATDYLIRKGWIAAKRMLDGSFIFIRIEPEGIDLIETRKNEFKKNFGIGVNLGLISFNFGASE